MKRLTLLPAVILLSSCASTPPTYDIAYTPVPGSESAPESLDIATEYCGLVAEREAIESGSQTTMLLVENTGGDGIAGGIRRANARSRLEAERQAIHDNEFSLCMLEAGYLVRRECTANCPD